MAKKQDYRPLALTAGILQEKPILDIFKEQGAIPADADTHEFLEYALRQDFLLPTYAGKFRDFNEETPRSQWANMLVRHTLQNEKQQLSAVGPEMRFIRMRTEIKDALTQNTIVEEWARYKLVYKIDREFFGELVRTRDKHVSRDALLHLPARFLYLDFSDVDAVKPLYGAFVYITDAAQIALQMIAMNDEKDPGTDLFFSFYSNLQYDANGIADKKMENIVFGTFTGADISTEATVEFSNDMRLQVADAIYDILTFLSAENRDVMESPVTKQTYRPSKTIRNKFSEIQMWDVGVRYGAAIKAAKAEIKRLVGGQEADGEETDTVDDADAARTRKRKRPRPYIRCAHWHLYRVGPGRKDTVIKWIAPIFVNGETELPLVIRELKQ